MSFPHRDVTWKAEQDLKTKFQTASWMHPVKEKFELLAEPKAAALSHVSVHTQPVWIIKLWAATWHTAWTYLQYWCLTVHDYALLLYFVYLFDIHVFVCFTSPKAWSSCPFWRVTVVSCRTQQRCFIIKQTGLEVVMIYLSSHNL